MEIQKKKIVLFDNYMEFMNTQTELTFDTYIVLDNKTKKKTNNGNLYNYYYHNF